MIISRTVRRLLIDEQSVYTVHVILLCIMHTVQFVQIILSPSTDVLRILEYVVSTLTTPVQLQLRTPTTRTTTTTTYNYNYNDYECIPVPTTDDNSNLPCLLLQPLATVRKCTCTSSKIHNQSLLSCCQRITFTTNRCTKDSLFSKEEK